MGCPAPGRKETTRGSGAARSRNRPECSTGRTCGPVPRRSPHPEAGAGPKQPDPHPARPQPRTVVEIADVRVVEIGHGLRHGEQAATATPRPPLTSSLRDRTARRPLSVRQLSREVAGKGRGWSVVGAWPWGSTAHCARSSTHVLGSCPRGPEAFRASE